MEFSRPAKVGAMSVALLGALYGGYRFVSPDSGTSGGYSVYSYLPDATGIAPHSRVMMSGIPVGVIDKISLDHGRARIDVKMNPNVPLYTDAAIGKRASSLIGESYIVLTPGTEGYPQIPDKGEITHYIEEPTVQSLEGQIKDILTDVKAVTKSLSNSVGSDKGQAQMQEILEHLAEITKDLDAAVKENRQGVKDTIATVNNITSQSRPEIAAILENVRTITDDLKQMTAQGQPAGNGNGNGNGQKPGDLRSTIERVNRASASLESALQHADNVAARIDKGEGTVGRLTKDETLINEVQGVVEDVGDFVGGLHRVQTVVGLRTDYNFLANTIKSYVELRLQPSEDKYYLIQLVNDPRGKTSITQRDVDTTNPNEPAHYRETVTETTNAFRFTFQFAKRLGPFTGRFGIMESTGGLGLDVHLLDDRFELQQDLFGFGEELSPRWRVTLGYEFIRKLWLLGGADDILNSARRDYFVGLQLRFTDDDLKLILPFAASGL